MSEVLAQALKAINTVKSQPDVSGPVHAAVMAALSEHGFVVGAEVPIRYVRSNAKWKNGRIDIVAHRDGEAVAIEIDARKPRKSSINKLRAYNGYRICVLRGVNCPEAPRPLDAVISIPVHVENPHKPVTRRREVIL